jgi:EAL domain-containing protein (putative c-di-GMP-specific phosphodiesterase class I)
MDDFGTGSSSLSYLKKLPLDQLKIDQGLVKNMTSDQNDKVMVQTIIDMAQNFTLNVIASQMKLLNQLGCTAHQVISSANPCRLNSLKHQ